MDVGFNAVNQLPASAHQVAQSTRHLRQPFRTDDDQCNDRDDYDFKKLISNMSCVFVDDLYLRLCIFLRCFIRERTVVAAFCVSSFTGWLLR